MSGGAGDLILRRESSGGGIVVAWPGAPGDESYFAHALSVYANDTEPRVPVLAHAAFGMQVASQLDVLAAPEQYLQRDATGAVVETFPTRQVAPVATFFASPTTVPVIGVATALERLRALDPNASDPMVAERNRYALAASATLDAMARDRTIAAPSTAGFPAAVAVVGVIVAVVAFDEWMAHLDHVSEVEADASVRRERELRAAATRDAIERMRQTVAATPAGHPVTWSNMPAPTANEVAARESIQRAAETEWERIARQVSQGVAQTASTVSTALLWGGGLYLAWKMFSSKG